MNAVRILPRRYLIHPTLQPIQQVMQPTKSSKPVVNVRVPSTAKACGEYRECASLLRTLGRDIAAGLLEATADALSPQPMEPVVVPPALENYDYYDDETVVRDIDSLMGEDTLSGAEIPE